MKLPLLKASHLKLIAAAAGVAGLAACATGPRPVEQALSSDHYVDWNKKVETLPVELHGAAPGTTPSQTAAAVQHGVTAENATTSQNSGLSLYVTQRVVVYIGGSTAPERNQYCSLTPKMMPSVLQPPNVLMLRSALCDGPRVVAFSRNTIPVAQPSLTTVASTIENVKGDLVESLPQPEAPMPVY